MLVLTLSSGEAVSIGEDTVLKVTDIRRDRESGRLVARVAIHSDNSRKIAHSRHLSLHEHIRRIWNNVFKRNGNQPPYPLMELRQPKRKSGDGTVARDQDSGDRSDG